MYSTVQEVQRQQFGYLIDVVRVSLLVAARDALMKLLAPAVGQAVVRRIADQRGPEAKAAKP